MLRGQMLSYLSCQGYACCSLQSRLSWMINLPRDSTWISHRLRAFWLSDNHSAQITWMISRWWTHSLQPVDACLSVGPLPISSTALPGGWKGESLPWLRPSLAHAAHWAPGSRWGRKGTGSANEVTLQWAKKSWSWWTRWWMWSHGINHFERGTR